MKKYRVGLVGTGGIAHFHLMGYKPMGNVEVVAVCDINVPKAEQFAEKWGVPLESVYQDYMDLIARDDLDVVDICTPNFLHSIIAVAALESGKHVITEKPDAVSVEDAIRMAKAARTSGKTLMAIRNNRFKASSQMLKNYIDDGQLGDLYTGRCGWMRRRGIPGKGGWFTTKEQSGGGPLIDLGVHMIDLTLWLMGNPKPISVVGNTYCKFATADDSADSIHSTFGEAQAGGTFDVEDLANGYIIFDNGASLFIEFSWASNIEQEHAYSQVLGDKGGFYYDLFGSGVKIFSTIGSDTADIKPNVSTEGGHGEQFVHFFKCLDAGVEPIVTPEQGVDMIKILCGIYESAANGGKQVLL